MSSSETYLELRFAGDVGPADFRARDVATALKEFESLVRETLRREDNDVNPEDITVGLVQVKEGSNALRFKSSHQSKVLALLSVVGKALAEKRYDDLSDKQRSKLKGIQKVGSRYDSPSQFGCAQEGEHRDVLGVIEIEDEIPGPKMIRGMTTLYGRVERVGGKEPKVHVRTRDNETVIISLEQEQARQLANQLYEMVGLRGEAEWFVETGQIDSFKLGEIIEYSGGGVAEGFEKLSEAVGGAFDNVDPAEYTRRMRGRTIPSTRNGSQE